MKKKSLLCTLALSSLALSCALCPVGAKNASADGGELRYYYPEIEMCNVYSESVACTSVDETATTTAYGMPLYYATGSLTNCCGAVGGAIVVGFYDRYYEDLIPDWTPYSTVTYKYKRADTTYVPAVIQELYTLMRTNVDDVGVSQADCKSGLQTYFSNRGRTLSYSTIESNSTFNYSLYKQAIQANKPVLMFCNNVTLTLIGGSNGESAPITYQDIPDGHIIVGYGYTTVYHYNGDEVVRETEYLLVSSGRSSLASAYVEISSTSWLVDGYAVTVS